MSCRNWFMYVVFTVALVLGMAAVLVWLVDPYFHYRAPQIDRFRYSLDNQRFQNDGIVRHFDYRTLVTGSSMCENFKASDVERLWGLKAVKVPFEGASYRELSQIVLSAVKANPKLELIIVGLDFNKLIMAPDWMRNDLGNFPHYLYDDDPWNDVRYLLNRDAVWKSLEAVVPWGSPGITGFDEYSCWHTAETRYGADAVLKGLYIDVDTPMPQQPDIDPSRKRMVAENIRRNLEPIMKCGRKVLFFLTPYSSARMYCWIRSGRLWQQLQAERQLAEAVFRFPNVRLFSFNDRTDVTGNLANYRDLDHYGPWINTQILEWMHAGDGELTRANLDGKIEIEYASCMKFDYQKIFRKIP